MYGHALTCTLSLGLLPPQGTKQVYLAGTRCSNYPGIALELYDLPLASQCQSACTFLWPPCEYRIYVTALYIFIPIAGALQELDKSALPLHSHPSRTPRPVHMHSCWWAIPGCCTASTCGKVAKRSWTQNSCRELLQRASLAPLSNAKPAQDWW